MRLLAIETSSAVASLALYEAGAVTRADHFAAGMTLCQELPGRILGLLECGRLADAGLTGLAVSLGPGSFTGLRVGLALAKAAAHCLGLPLVGVPSPEVIAAGLGAAEARIAVLQHSRADEMYVTLFEAGEETGDPRVGTGATFVASLAEAVQRVVEFGEASEETGDPRVGTGVPPVPGGRDARRYARGATFVACGDAIARHRDALTAAFAGITLAPEDQQYPRAEALAGLAAERVAIADPQAMFALTPAYVVPSQAERAAGEKQAAEAQER